MFKCSNHKCGCTTVLFTTACPTCGREKTLVPHLEPVLLEATQSKNEPQEVTGISSGIHELDLLLPEGFMKGWMYLFAAMQGTGKTSLLLLLAVNLTRQGAKVMFFSGEMSHSQISYMAKRYQLNISGIVFAYDNDLASICNTARANRVQFLMLDSLQTIHGDTVHRTTWTEQANNSLALKHFAEKSRVTVLAISQVNRDGSIAGPNAVVHNADVVLKLTQGASDEVIVKTEKNRQITGTVDRFVFRKTATGPKPVSDVETCDITRHGKMLFRNGFAATPVRYGDDFTVDELTAVKASGLVIQGLDNKTTAFLAGVLCTQYPGIMLDLAIMGNRCHKLEADNLLALAMCILSSHFNFEMPVDVAFFGSIDHQGKIITAREMSSRTGRAISQTYRAIFGPMPIGSAIPSWIPCTDINDVLRKLANYLKK